MSTESMPSDSKSNLPGTRDSSLHTNLQHWGLRASAEASTSSHVQDLSRLLLQMRATRSNTSIESTPDAVHKHIDLQQVRMRQHGPTGASTEVDWDRLDKTKFFGVGTGLFTGVTLALYPFSVIKTRLQIAHSGVHSLTQMSGPTQRAAAAAIAASTSSAAQSSAAGASAAVGVVRNTSMVEIACSIARTEGLPGFYRGLSTVVAGMLPGRILFMGTLEAVKKTGNSALHALGGPQALGLSDAGAAGLISAVGGTCASLSTQAVTVPVDVISSRLMAQATLPPDSTVTRYKGGLDALKSIIRTEGVRGLYRGFGVSVITYAPSSFTWWGTYGASQRLFWNAYFADKPPPGLRLMTASASAGEGVATNRPGQIDPPPPPVWLLAGVQAGGGMLAGVCAALATTPLDTVKTRIQVERGGGGVGSMQAANVRAVVQQLLAEGGIGAFYKGLLPRSISMALWGTAMVSAYEFLKRLCVIDR